jgi:hypothetical protein
MQQDSQARLHHRPLGLEPRGTKGLFEELVIDLDIGAHGSP